MSWRIQGLSNAFKKASSAAANRSIGQLVHITTAGEATTLVGGESLAFPLTQNFDYSNDLVAEVQVTGVAKMYVETATSIAAGSPVTIGSTGVGIAVATEGDLIIGIALATPAGATDSIPVLLAPFPKASTIY